MEVLEIPSEIKDLVSYNPNTGELIWLVSPNKRVPAGSRVGSVNSSGYYTAGFENKYYQVSRIIWFIYYGVQPKGVIDHINRDRLDNRIDNLRDVDIITNRRNSSLPKGRLYKGLYKDGKVWTVRPNGDKSIGRFKCFADALRCWKEFNIESA